MSARIAQGARRTSPRRGTSSILPILTVRRLEPSLLPRASARKRVPPCLAVSLIEMRRFQPNSGADL